MSRSLDRLDAERPRKRAIMLSQIADLSAVPARACPPAVTFAETGAKGRGVFALKDYQPAEHIETAPVIVIPAAQWPLMERTVLYHYGFMWGAGGEDMAIALGYGSLYNHSYQPNARYVRHPEAGTIEFVALRPIWRGEEITVNYNGDPASADPLWFDVRD
jgi:SET domain-containing protein